jgi:hypothetical protein
MINSKFCFASHYCRDMEYCDKCNNSHDCFGSIGIMKNEYIIFNKKYSENEYKVIKQKIIEHMRKTREYGEFFPSGTSGFKYEETIAAEYYPEKERIVNNYKVNAELPICSKCNKNFKIISQEKEFYQRQSLSLPKFCPECRHQTRNIRAGLRILFNKNCVKCNTKIKTTHENQEVYCEKCYNQAIY